MDICPVSCTQVFPSRGCCLEADFDTQKTIQKDGFLHGKKFINLNILLISLVSEKGALGEGTLSEDSKNIAACAAYWSPPIRIMAPYLVAHTDLIDQYLMTVVEEVASKFVIHTDSIHEIF